MCRVCDVTPVCLFTDLNTLPYKHINGMRMVRMPVELCVFFFFFAAHVVSLATHAQRVGPWRSSNAYMHMLKDGLLRSAGPVWLWLSLVCCDHCDFTLLFLFEVPPFFFFFPSPFRGSFFSHMPPLTTQ